MGDPITKNVGNHHLYPPRYIFSLLRFQYSLVGCSAGYLQTVITFSVRKPVGTYVINAYFAFAFAISIMGKIQNANGSTRRLIMLLSVL